MFKLTATCHSCAIANNPAAVRRHNRALMAVMWVFYPPRTKYYF